MEIWNLERKNYSCNSASSGISHQVGTLHDSSFLLKDHHVLVSVTGLSVQVMLYLSPLVCSALGYSGSLLLLIWEIILISQLLHHPRNQSLELNSLWYKYLKCFLFFWLKSHCHISLLLFILLPFPTSLSPPLRPHFPPPVSPPPFPPSSFSS